MNTATMILDACECGRDDCMVCTVLIVGFGPTDADLSLEGDEDDVYPDGYDPSEDEPLLLTDEVDDFIMTRRQEVVARTFEEAQLMAHEVYGDDLLDPDLPAGITESLADWF